MGSVGSVGFCSGDAVGFCSGIIDHVVAALNNLMSVKIQHHVKLHSSTMILGDVVDPEVEQILVNMFPDARYHGSFGGAAQRVMQRTEPVNGRARYAYGDEFIQWSNDHQRWDMLSVYQGLINFSMDDVAYPYQCTTWRVGDAAPQRVDADVTVVPYVGG